MPNPGSELASLDFANLIGGPLNAVITAQSNAAISTANFIKTVGFDENNKPVYVDFKYPKEVVPYVPAANPKVLSVKVNTAVVPNTFQPNEKLMLEIKTTAPEKTIIKASASIDAAANGSIAANTFASIINSGEFKSGIASADFTVTLIGDSSATVTTLDCTITPSTFIAATPAVYQEMKFSVPILTMLPIPFIKVDEITIDFNAKINSMQTQSSSSEFDAKLDIEGRYGGRNSYVKVNASVAYKKTNSSGSSIERTYSMGIHVRASQDEMPAGMEKLLGILEGAMISTPGNVLPQ
jgi:hypothetical protein